MQIDPTQHTKTDNYKLLTSLVIPRPIAWITSLGANGILNLAPFSFFNAVSGNPMYIVVGIGRTDAGETKDTARNIQDTGEFVVNLVTEELFDAMNISAADFPPEIGEVDAMGLQVATSARVSVPRLADSQASLECKLFSSQPLGENTLIIGEVVMFHIADHLIDDRLYVKGFNPVGRLGTPSMYCRTTDRFDKPRISYAEWLKSQSGN
jgi:flavin reductase (DIM6/NTAB) family NADH-FMN oxidoreductase RutF